MNKKPQELFHLARQALLRAGAHETMAEDLLAKIEELAAA